MNNIRLTRRGYGVIAWTSMIVFAALFLTVSYIESAGTMP